MDSWLIRSKHDVAYVWKRKYFLGLIAIPWAFHGGTRTIFTPDAHDDTVLAAIDYINDQYENSKERIKVHVQWETENE